MRLPLVLAFMLATTTASADSRADVEKLVRAHIEAMAKDRDTAYKATVVESLFVIGPNAGLNTPWWSWKCEAGCSGSLRIFEGYVVQFVFTIPKPAIVVDDANHLAVFDVTVQAKGRVMTDGMDAKGTWILRVAGAAIDDHGWKIAAVQYGLTMTDKAFMNGHFVATDRDDHPISGDVALGKEVQSWLPGHLGDHASARAVAASGTAPAEVATDKAGIAKVVKVWDKMKIKVEETEITMLPGDKAAWVTNFTIVPTKAGGYEVTQGMVVVKEGAEWKWLLMTWSPSVTMMDAVH